MSPVFLAPDWVREQFVESDPQFHLGQMQLEMSERTSKGHGQDFQRRRLGWKHECQNVEAKHQSKRPALNPFRGVVG